MLLLKSSKNTAMLNTDNNTVTLKGKTFPLNPGLVLSPGDIISIHGEDFIALRPEPVFFKDFARRSAQIIQPWDAASILLYCTVSPGTRVLESGCGSGALSLAILRATGKEGSLTSVERDASNIEIARENLSRSIKNPNWTLVYSDIEEYSTRDRYDVIILDIPEPWKVIGKLSTNLVSGGRICCYAPTFNQLEKNNIALKKAGFYVFENMEIIKRSLLVRENATRPDNDMIGHTAYLTFAVKKSGSAMR